MLVVVTQRREEFREVVVVERVMRMPPLAAHPEPVKADETFGLRN